MFDVPFEVDGKVPVRRGLCHRCGMKQGERPSRSLGSDVPLPARLGVRIEEGWQAHNRRGRIPA